MKKKQSMKKTSQNKPQILVIDSDSMLSELISSHFYKRIEITRIDSLDHLLQIDVTDFTLIILNPGIDGDSGRQIVDMLRGNFEHTIPILLVSNSNSKPDIMKCMNAGATDFISRPFEISVLVSRISKYIGIASD